MWRDELREAWGREKGYERVRCERARVARNRTAAAKGRGRGSADSSLHLQLPSVGLHCGVVVREA